MLKVIIDTNVLLSGLFFKGNERKLLEQFLLGKIALLLPEHVVVETERIIERKAERLGNKGNAMAMLSLVTDKAIICKSSEYANEVGRAEKLIRDKKDAPILAAVMAIGHDYFVSGDKDFEVLGLATHVSASRLLGIIGK